MAETKKVMSMKGIIGELADDIEGSLLAMHAGMRAGDQTAINTASEALEDHIRELRIMADTLPDPEPLPLPPIVGTALTPVPEPVPEPAPPPSEPAPA